MYVASALLELLDLPALTWHRRIDAAHTGRSIDVSICNRLTDVRRHRVILCIEAPNTYAPSSQSALAR